MNPPADMDPTSTSKTSKTSKTSTKTKMASSG
jgi:hypothetical protein